jgi:hypothetical protein
MQKFIYEIFENTCKIESRDERIKYLKENSFGPLITILQLQYHDKVKLDLPKGKPPFTPCTEQTVPRSERSYFQGIEQCIPNSKVDRYKKEKTFIEILESIHPEDAAILCAAKDGNLLSTNAKKYSKITKSLVEACFPTIL